MLTYAKVNRTEVVHSVIKLDEVAMNCVQELQYLDNFKKVKFDPLFSLNHTFAMLRANVNRLFRKTWCTTKKPQRLADHLALYALYHNEVLT